MEILIDNFNESEDYIFWNDIKVIGKLREKKIIILEIVSCSIGLN